MYMTDAGYAGVRASSFGSTGGAVAAARARDAAREGDGLSTTLSHAATRMESATRVHTEAHLGRRRGYATG